MYVSKDVTYIFREDDIIDALRKAEKLPEGDYTLSLDSNDNCAWLKPEDLDEH